MFPDDSFELPFLPETNETVRRKTFGISPTVKQQSVYQGASMIPAAQAAQQQAAPDKYAGYAQQRAGYEADLAKYRAAEEKLEEPPDYSNLKQYAQQRSQTFLPMAMSAALLGRGPQGVQPLAQMAAKQAGSAFDPIKVEGGYIDSSGQEVIDPGYQKQKRLEASGRRIAALEKLIASNVDDETKARANDEKLREQQRYHDLSISMKEQGLEIQRGMLGLRQQMAADRRAASDASKSSDIQHLGVNAAGETVYFDKKLRKNMVTGADGTNRPAGPQDNPYTAEGMAKRQDIGRKVIATEGALGRMEEMIRKNPAAFGGVASLAALTPQVLGSRILAGKLTPEQQQARVMVMNYAAEVVKQIYGAAQTAQEYGRAVEFVPDPKDNHVTILRKLAAARQWQQEQMSELPPAMLANLGYKRRSTDEPAGGGGGGGGVDVGAQISAAGAGGGAAPPTNTGPRRVQWKSGD